MLCIEMAIFAVMHLFAFPWKEYSLKHRAPKGDETKYSGGPLGLKALADAFNPWDIVKASARGFRWLFVGYKHREKDISYQPHKLDGSLDESATELRSSDDERLGRDRAGTVGTVDTTFNEDDSAGLLQNSAQPARVPSASPPRMYRNDSYAPGDDSTLDLTQTHQLRPTHSSDSETPNSTAFSKASDFDSGQPVGFEEDTGYHPGYDGRGVHAVPGYQDGSMQPWDHWSGAQRSTDVESMRPPSYPTQDPHR